MAMKQNPTPDADVRAIRPNDDDDDDDEQGVTAEEREDALDTEDARQDPQGGALNPGQRRESSDDAMRRERSDPNPETARKHRR